MYKLERNELTDEFTMMTICVFMCRQIVSMTMQGVYKRNSYKSSFIKIKNLFKVMTFTFCREILQLTDDS